LSRSKFDLACFQDKRIEKIAETCRNFRVFSLPTAIYASKLALGCSMQRYNFTYFTCYYATETYYIVLREYMMNFLKLAMGICSIAVGFFPSACLANCPYDTNCIDNPYGAGSPYAANGVNNPYSATGSPYSNTSVNNPYATNAPKLYGSDGTYLGKMSANKYDPDSTSNPYGKYGSPYSSTSVNNPYSTYGSPYSSSPVYVVPQE
jgi:GR25 family glycosyltransferase involved in LPS biosynthesis